MELSPYEIIAKEIRDEIVSGKYQPGDRIPSTRQLVDQYGVAKNTVDKAMRLLRDYRLVKSRRGIGVIVAEHLTADSPKDMFTRTFGLKKGIRLPGEKSVFRGCGIEDTPTSVATAMGIPAFSRSIRRSRRIERAGQGAVCLATSWYPIEFREKAPLLLEPEPIKEGTPNYLQRVLGTSVHVGLDTVEAESAGIVIAQELRCEVREPVMHISSKLTDQNGNVIEVGEYHYRQKFQVSYPYEFGNS